MQKFPKLSLSALKPYAQSTRDKNATIIGVEHADNEDRWAKVETYVVGGNLRALVDSSELEGPAEEVLAFLNAAALRIRAHLAEHSKTPAPKPKPTPRYKEVEYRAMALDEDGAGIDPEHFGTLAEAKQRAREMLGYDGDAVIVERVTRFYNGHIDDKVVYTAGKSKTLREGGWID